MSEAKPNKEQLEAEVNDLMRGFAAQILVDSQAPWEDSEFHVEGQAPPAVFKIEITGWPRDISVEVGGAIVDGVADTMKATLAEQGLSDMFSDDELASLCQNGMAERFLDFMLDVMLCWKEVDGARRRSSQSTPLTATAKIGMRADQCQFQN